MRRTWIPGLVLACACGTGNPGTGDSGPGPADALVFIRDAAPDANRDASLPDTPPDLADPGTVDPASGDPGPDPASDPVGPADPGNDAAVPDPGPVDNGSPDPAAQDPGTIDPGDDPGAPDPGTPDPGPDDPGPPDADPVDPGAVDPGAVDPGFDVSIGACAPDDTACWCTLDDHCDPSHDAPCRPNLCDTDSHHCRLDSQRLDGQPCDDSDACTLGETCQGGTCGGGSFTCECRTEADCGDTDPCTLDACDLSTHTCTHVPVAAACDDGDPCTTPDTCVDGTCIPGPDTCECRKAADCPDPGNPCLDRACSPDHTCVPTPNSAACDDGHPCTSGDACSGGACVYQTPTCADCGDGACFPPDEDCLSCPGDCGACPTTETDCGNGGDEDHDGLADCQDLDCVGKSPCPQDTCSGKVDATVQCGTILTTRYNSLNLFYGSGCGDRFDLYKKVVQFVAPRTGTLQVQVTHESATSDDFHAYVLSGVCNPEACIAKACCKDPGLAVPMVAGMSYFIVVQDKNPSDTGRYTLTVTCP